MDIKNAQRLKNKILLIDSSDLDKEVTLEMIKEVYPYPFEIVGYHKIENSIVNQDAKFAYVQIVPITSAGVTSINPPEKLVADYSFGLRVIDAEDDLILGI